MPHIQCIHMERIPNTTIMETIHIVPVISKFDTEPDMASASQCILFPLRK